MWNKTITLYNAYTDTNGKTNYILHHISGCFVKKVVSKTDSGMEQRKNENTIVRIPAQSKYVAPSSWLLFTLKDKFITLQPDDIIVIGKVNDVIDDLVAGQRATDLIGKYNAVRISSITINDEMPRKHYKVVAQ